jgi:hypothetical protein
VGMEAKEKEGKRGVDRRSTVNAAAGVLLKHKLPHKRLILASWAQGYTTEVVHLIRLKHSPVDSEDAVKVEGDDHHIVGSLGDRGDSGGHGGSSSVRLRVLGRGLVLGGRRGGGGGAAAVVGEAARGGGEEGGGRGEHPSPVAREDGTEGSRLRWAPQTTHRRSGCEEDRCWSGKGTGKLKGRG